MIGVIWVVMFRPPWPADVRLYYLCPLEAGFIQYFFAGAGSGPHRFVAEAARQLSPRKKRLTTSVVKADDDTCRRQQERGPHAGAQTGTLGVTVAEIWQAIAEARTIGRTTVLNQVDRLEKRDWLRRLPGEGSTRFRAALSKDDASRQLVAGFVSDYFDGSSATWSRHCWAALRAP